MSVVCRPAGIFFILFLLSFYHLAAQDTNTYPRITGHFGIIHPIITFNSEGSETNFTKSYTVGFPTGINLIKSDRIGFSFEIVPRIKAQDGQSKVEKLLFHPGVVLRFRSGFSFTARAAFETSGRYGFTPVFTKVIKKNKDSSFYLSFVTPARFGNQTPSSLTLGMQLGLAF